MDDLAQFSPLRRPKRFATEEPPFRFETPIVFKLAPPAPLVSVRREPACPHALGKRYG